MTEVNVGTAANDGTGDPLRTAFIKLNGDITALKEGLYAIKQVPDAIALLAAVAITQAAADVVTAINQTDFGSIAAAVTLTADFGSIAA